MTGLALHRRELSAGRPLLGTWIKIPAIEVVEVLALAGLDFVVIDMEHAPIDISQVSTLTAVARGLGLPILVRVPEPEATYIKRVLDAGADGVVVPRVDSVELARDVVNAVHFPPIGRRGSGVTSRAGAWGIDGAENYFAIPRDHLSVLAQIESVLALQAVSDIAGVAGIDGVLIGPADTALSLLEPQGGPRSTAMIHEAEDVLAKSGSFVVTTGGVRDVDELTRRGYSMLVIGNDAAFLAAGARAVVGQG